jgi:hypothetical protein
MVFFYCEQLGVVEVKKTSNWRNKPLFLRIFRLSFLDFLSGHSKSKAVTEQNLY